jgi:hypothetical protein
MKLFIILIFLIHCAYAETFDFLGQKEEVFTHSEHKHILLSEKCKVKCLATELMNSIKQIKSLKFETHFGQEPGAVICHKLLSLNVMIGKDANGDERSFCVLPDQSLISSDGVYWLYMN